ncbi:hypothetical protein H4582DRAFT_2092137 [Lactarius indigo]|nr:hypothetical protein H4582DRAFT_2092137 [Lactarius indigo]
MLTPSLSRDQDPQQPLLCNSEAGPSDLPPPSFEDGHLVFDIDKFPEPFLEGGEDPPEFTPYKAEHWVSTMAKLFPMAAILMKTVRGGGHAVMLAATSHFIPTGEALYRFLLSQAETPPTFLVHCRVRLYGWDLDTLEAAIHGAIKSTRYRGDHVEVEFQSRNSMVIVRPDMRISRAISNRGSSSCSLLH